MTIQQAIEKAIEGNYAGLSKKGRDILLEQPWQITISDPNFWNCLGRGLGNKDEMRCDSEHCDSVQCEYAGYKDPRTMFESFMMNYIWEGKSAELFFEKL